MTVIDVKPREYDKAERQALATARYHMLRRGRKFPVKAADLDLAVAGAKDVAVQRFPVGTHLGWSPSWMGIGPRAFSVNLRSSVSVYAEPIGS